MLRAWEKYQQAVGPDKITRYTGTDGHSLLIDAWAMSNIKEQLLDADGCVLELWEHDDQLGGYRVEYRGRMLGQPQYAHQPDAVSGVAFWLPTEYMEEQGPTRVKALALALARELPFNTGYVSPAFNGLMDMQRVRPLIHDSCFRYPGLDIFDIEVTQQLGTRPKGSYWLNFYGQPLLSELGGVTRLREQLTLPGVSVRELEPDKVLVELGEWPEVEGDMPAYRQLARMLEPHLYQETKPPLPPEDMRRWERRFLGNAP
ncbi:type VI immunity family protein [Melittangium boletus]|uniref:type VI immunity family protein n=1 Tax=Melittangium boletus TaxID=83453 RepID=UPI001C54EB14|nr:type VI immunity family protein [Melittangium boletus]